MEESLDYNTQREKLLMPEYGRHVQKMINYVAGLPDKEKRDGQIKTVITVMGTINPQLKEMGDFKHKLWDHMQIISDFKIDVDSPYPLPTKDNLVSKPNPIPLVKTPVKASHYGRNIQNMLKVIAEHEDGQIKTHMIKTLATYMKQQYLIWNKDSVTEKTIFNDIYMLSDGKITVPEEVHIGMGISSETPLYARGAAAGRAIGAGRRPQKSAANRKRHNKK